MAPVARSSEPVPVFTKTGLVAFSQVWQLQPGHETLVAIVKASARLLPQGPAALCETQPPQGDVYAGDDHAGSYRYPSDFAIIKPKCDVVLHGHAHAPGGQTRVMQVRFRFGAEGEGFDRRVAVFGPRRWSKSGLGAKMGEPEVFERVPLVWERAFGGEALPANPMGVGFDGAALPQLESPEQLIVSPRDRPAPVALCAVPVMFPARWSKLGTYDQQWQKERFPYFAEDFDPAFFQAAPPEQQIDRIRDGAPYRIEGVHPEYVVIEGTLPAIRPRLFTQRTAAAGGAFDEVALRLDTIVFDTDALRVDLIWRGRASVADARAQDVAELYLFDEAPEQKALNAKQARARYHAERGLSVGPGGQAAEPSGQAAGSSGQPTRQPTGGGLTEPAEGEHVALVEAPLAAAAVATATPADPESALAAGTVDAATPADPDAQPDGRTRAEALLATPGPLDGVVLEDANLLGLDLSGRSLRGSRLQRSNLRGCKLAGADLTGALLAGADLSEADLSGARLDLADLRGATLDRAMLTGASLSYTDMAEVSGRSACFDEANGKLTSFIEGSWQDASFAGAQLRGPAFSSADISRARFDGALLEEIRLYDTRGAEVSFQDAQLLRARADGAQLRDCNFERARLDDAVWDRASLIGCRFVDALLLRAGLRETTCSGAHFTRADLREARLAYAELTGVMLGRANLMAVNLEGADLTGADLRGANLHAAETWKAKLDDAKLQGAILTGSKLAGRAS